MLTFSAQIDIIGVNPYVLLPEKVLAQLFARAKKSKGPLPVKGKLNGHSFTQTLVKYAGQWRLYLNTPMRQVSGTVVGDQVKISIDYDPRDRTAPMHPALKKALEQDLQAMQIFQSLISSRQKEIMRYINHLKTTESVARNVTKTIEFLHGRQRHIGRDKP